MEPFDLGWLVGIIEGEGSMHISKTTTQAGNPREQPWLTVNMTDEDTINRLREVTGIGGVRPLKVQPNRKPQWLWSVSSIPQLAWILPQIIPHLSIRRRYQASRVMELVGVKQAESRLHGIRFKAGKWQAEVTVNGVYKYVGRFDSRAEAALAASRARADMKGR